MREILFRNLSRLFAVLGCSTLVTACYGVPYDDYHSVVSGKAVDADNGMPVEGLMVRVTTGYRSQGGHGPVQGLVPLAQSGASLTEADGCFEESLTSHQEPDGVLIECHDIDGQTNGSYSPKSQVYAIEEAGDIVIRVKQSDPSGL